jgi:hypothetical protein
MDPVVHIAPWVDSVLFKKSLGIRAVVLLESAIEGQSRVPRRKYDDIFSLLRLEDVVKYGEGCQARTDMRLLVSERNI